MQRSILSATFMMCVVTAGAQHISATPVDNGSYTIPAYAAGNWKEEQHEEAGQTYTILVDYNKTGRAQLVPNHGNMRPIVLSSAGGKTFISLYDAGGRERPAGYHLFRLSVVAPDRMRIVPLKDGLDVPQGITLKDYLAKADTAAIDAPYAYWLVNLNHTRKQPVDTTGRKINITKKP